MIEYFKTTTPKDFKNSKKFWKFYSSFMPLKSDKSGKQLINTIKHGSVIAEDPISIGNLFNNFFTSLSSVSTADTGECFEFSKKHFDNIKDKLFVKESSFKFKKITYSEVEYQIRIIDVSTGASISCLPTKLFNIFIIKYVALLLIFSIIVLLKSRYQKNGKQQLLRHYIKKMVQWKK